ncbi:hypothetical protein WDW86_22585 [Bdellovibrionota bacterium FG-2]
MKIGVDGHDDGYFSSTKKWLAVYHQSDVLIPRLATLDDFYQSEKFLSGGFKLKDFLRVDSAYPLVATADLKLRYPLIYKILNGSPLSLDEERVFFKELAWTMGSFFSQWKRKGQLADIIKTRFARKVIPAMLAEMPQSLRKGIFILRNH